MAISVSIIIPVYNGQKTILNCIDNIIKKNQNINKEIIVINDGSTDKTSKILKKIKNIKFFNLKKNKGVGYARQYGANKAKYDLLCYVDSDVFISKNSIKELIKKLKSSSKIGSVGAIQKPSNLNKNEWTSNFVCLKSCYGFEDVKKDVDFSVIHSEFCVISKKYLNSIGGWRYYSGAGGEEFELGFRIIESKKRIILIKNVFYTTFYPNLYTRFKEIIFRTEAYIDLFLKKKRFDSKGSFATSEQAISSFITLIYIAILFISLFININISIFMIAVITQIIVEYSFIRFAFKIYGFRMLIFSIFAIQVINAGIIIGAFKFIQKKIF